MLASIYLEEHPAGEPSLPPGRLHSAETMRASIYSPERRAVSPSIANESRVFQNISEAFELGL